MKIALCGSTDFYPEMDRVKNELMLRGHEVLHPRDTAPNSINTTFTADHKQNMSAEARTKKNVLIKSHMNAIADSDAILVVNLEKNGVQNYIGGNVFLEMGFALAYKKKIFVLNPLPESSYIDEITGMLPIVLDENLKNIA